MPRDEKKDISQRNTISIPAMSAELQQEMLHNHVFSVVTRPGVDGTREPIRFPFGDRQVVTITGPYNGDVDSIRFLAVPTNPDDLEDPEQYDYYMVLDPADRRAKSVDLRDPFLYVEPQRMRYDSLRIIINYTNPYASFAKMGINPESSIYKILPPPQTPNA